MEDRVLLVGGDGRQLWLARLLEGRSRVYTLGVPGRADRRPEAPVELLILPTPCLSPSGALRAGGLGWEALAGCWDGHTRLYGGALPEGLEALLPGCGPALDLLKDPMVAAGNARLTAEAALALCMERTEASLWGRDCLILGYGRIGKALGRLLTALRCRVTVGARRPEIRAEAAQAGLELWDLRGEAPKASLVFNTIPAPVLGPAALAGLGPDCLWVELASAPGGLPPEDQTPADAEGSPQEGHSLPSLQVLKGNSLPGRRLPRSAAELLLAGILRNEVKYAR